MKIKPFKLERYYTLYEHSAKYSLCNSDCEAMTIADLLAMEDGAKERFDNMWLGYTHTQGSPDLRRDIAQIYDQIEANDLMVCSGAQEPIYLFAHALLEAADEVIVQTPCYQSLQSVPESIGCKVSEWQVSYTDGTPGFDLSVLESLITDKTKAIFLNAPHNPTGFIFTRAEQAEIVGLARKHGIYVLCDEVYRELEHDPAVALPAFADVYERGVSIGVMSKAYGLPGLRIGWLATQDRLVLEQVGVLKEYTTICNSGPSEFLAGVALRNRHQILARNLEIVRANLPLYDAFFAKHAGLFSWYRPKAGPIGFVKMHFDTDDAAFCTRALQESKILLLPGSIYDYGGYFRVGFGRKAIPEALAQFDAFVTENLVAYAKNDTKSEN